jgi:hypothetical protein
MAPCYIACLSAYQYPPCLNVGEHTGLKPLCWGNETIRLFRWGYSATSGKNLQRHIEGQRRVDAKLAKRNAQTLTR